MNPAILRPVRLQSIASGSLHIHLHHHQNPPHHNTTHILMTDAACEKLNIMSQNLG